MIVSVPKEDADKETRRSGLENKEISETGRRNAEDVKLMPCLLTSGARFRPSVGAGERLSGKHLTFDLN
jgi:hypothetical protein